MLCECVCVSVCVCVKERERERWGVVSTRKHKLQRVPSPQRSVSVCEPGASSSSFRPSLIFVLLLLLPWILIHIYTCLAYICRFYSLGFFVFLPLVLS